jgi:hypothetical protein
MKINYSVKNILLGFTILLFILFAIFFFTPLAKYSIYLWLLIIILLGILFFSFKRRTNNFISGDLGERDIGNELKNLISDFICISDFETGRGNIDKIVIGPTGVWTLEVKSHKASLNFDGNILLNSGRPFERNFLSQAYAEAKTLGDLINAKTGLNINVQAVLVFSNKYAKVRLGLKQCKGVYVVQKAWLNKLLTETHVQRLDNLTVLKIKECLGTE